MLVYTVTWTVCHRERWKTKIAKSSRLTRAGIIVYDIKVERQDDKTKHGIIMKLRPLVTIEFTSL